MPPPPHLCVRFRSAALVRCESRSGTPLALVASTRTPAATTARAEDLLGVHPASLGRTARAVARPVGCARDRFRLRVVLVCLLYRLLCGVVGVLARGGGERELEIVVLRHQLAILGRGGRRPRYTTVDRALLAAASRLLPPERWSCFGVGPRTLRRWHRALLEGGRRGRRHAGLAVPRSRPRRAA